MIHLGLTDSERLDVLACAVLDTLDSLGMQAPSAQRLRALATGVHEPVQPDLDRLMTLAVFGDGAGEHLTGMRADLVEMLGFEDAEPTTGHPRGRPVTDSPQA